MGESEGMFGGVAKGLGKIGEVKLIDDRIMCGPIICRQV